MDQQILSSLKIIEHKLEYMRSVENLLERIASSLDQLNKNMQRSVQITEQAQHTVANVAAQSQAQAQMPRAGGNTVIN